MGVSKNFVVKNGIEVATELLYSDVPTSNIGIGTTVPTRKLDVNGNFNVVTHARVGGISTVEGKFGVGVGDTALYVDTGTERIGINTSVPGYNLDVIGDVGISSHLKVGGITTSYGLRVDGDTTINDFKAVGVSTITNVRIEAGFTTVTYSEAEFLNVTGLATFQRMNVTNLEVLGIATVNNLNITGVATFVSDVKLQSNLFLGDNDKILLGIGTDLEIYHDGSNSYIDDNGTGDLILRGSVVRVGGSGTTENMIVATQDGSVGLYFDDSLKLETTTTGINVTGLTDTDDLNVSGNVTISGVSTVGLITGASSIGADKLYALQLFGDGSQLTGIDTSGNFQGKTIICENVNASSPGVGTFGSVVINNPAGRITATEFYGDGLNLTNTGASLSDSSGTQRAVFTSLTSGRMTSASTDADVAFNATTSELLLGTNKIKLNASSGAATIAGNVDVGAYVNDSTDSDYVRIYSGGGIRLARKDGTNAESFTIYDGPSSNSANKTISLSSSGSAEFAAGAAIVSAQGKIEVKRNDTDPAVANINPSFVVKNAATNADAIKLLGKGDGEFDGTVSADLSVQVTRSNGKTVTMGGSDTVALWNSDGNFEINHNGTATFTSSVTASSFSGTLAGGDITADSIPNSALDNSTISGKELGTNLSILTRGSYLTGNNYDGSANQTWAVDATSSNTGSKVVARDGSGNFSAGTITAALSGTATNATNCRVDVDNSTNSSHFVIFTGGASSNQRLNSDTGLIYNPSSNTLTATTFSGNATTASNATNAGTLDGYDSSTSATANTVAVRNSSGDILMRYAQTSYVNMSHSASTRSSDSVFYSSTDDYIRKNNATGFRASLNVPTRTGGSASGTWSISISGNAATSTNCNGKAGSVTISYNNNANSSYQMLWGSGTSVYGTSGIVCNPSANSITASTFYGSFSGNASTSSNCNGNAKTSTNCNGNASTSSNCNGKAGQVTINNSDSNSNYYMLWHSGNTVYKTNGIYCNPGTDTVYASNFDSISDIRVKDNIKTLEGSLDKLQEIRGVEYDRNDQESRPHQLGVIAQEVEKIFPDVVNTDEEGKKTVTYQQLIPVLIEAVKELSQEVNDLKSELNK
jgi:hypothetical protein